MFFLGLLCFFVASPSFYKDVAPILQNHCQSCHRPGQIGPMPLETYAQARAKAKAIEQMVRSRKMPPWFADPQYGHFSNDPSLNAEEIQTIVSWVESGAPAGDPHDGPRPTQWAEGWNIPRPDRVIQMPRSEEHTSELQSRVDLVCRLLLEKKKKNITQ